MYLLKEGSDLYGNNQCGFCTMVSTLDCGSEDMGSIPIGHIILGG